MALRVHPTQDTTDTDNRDTEKETSQETLIQAYFKNVLLIQLYI